MFILRDTYIQKYNSTPIHTYVLTIERTLICFKNISPHFGRKSCCMKDREWVLYTQYRKNSTTLTPTKKKIVHKHHYYKPNRQQKWRDAAPSWGVIIKSAVKRMHETHWHRTRCCNIYTNNNKCNANQQRTNKHLSVEKQT